MAMTREITVLLTSQEQLMATGTCVIVQPRRNDLGWEAGARSLLQYHDIVNMILLLVGCLSRWHTYRMLANAQYRMQNKCEACRECQTQSPVKGIIINA